MMFQSLEEIVVAAAEGVRPPERLTVSQAAEKYRRLNNPGSYVGPWNNDVTPYLTEPMDELTSTAFVGSVFVGPAQTGKTDMLLNWMTHTAICDPADMMVIQTSQTTARDFSKRRIDRLHRHTPDVGSRLVQRRNYDNTFDKQYSSGMMVTLSWPTINELSGKPIPRLWLTDYDRMPQDIDGEGAPFDLAQKRATSFKSHGMTVAESSPGFIVDNPRWMQKSRHQAPPTTGILALYNRGDRRRWYWRCVSCEHAFEPDFNLLSWPKCDDASEAADQVILNCPHCGQIYKHDPDEKMGIPGKQQLNRAGRWVKDGQLWLPSGELSGTPARSDMASFWLKGVAATFTSWRDLVFKYLKAEEEFENTGSQSALKTTVNTDQGNPYVMRGSETERLPEELKARAQDYGGSADSPVVPRGVRFLIATIDVQKNRFVVQVHGFGLGSDVWVVDRYEIKKSDRLDPDGERFWVNPGAYPEDWQLLVEQVILKTYPLSDGSDRRMEVKLTLCDSGGREGVTTNAYNFYRWLRDNDEYANLHRRFQLLKGDPLPNAPRVSIRYPDSERKDRHAGARGEIPVLFLNSNSVKDTVDKMLARKDAGGGRVNFAKWLPDTFYTELTVEIKLNGKWENPKNFRNESWDLLVYAVAGSISRHIGIEMLDWDNPPGWAAEWDENDLIYNPVIQEKRFDAKPKAKYDLAALADELA